MTSLHGLNSSLRQVAESLSDDDFYSVTDEALADVSIRSKVS